MWVHMTTYLMGNLYVGPHDWHVSLIFFFQTIAVMAELEGLSKGPDVESSTPSAKTSFAKLVMDCVIALITTIAVKIKIIKT